MPRAKAGTSGTGVKKVRAPKGPKLPDPFDSGTILNDIRKKKWRLGPQIGQGGFGLIYLASDETDSSVGPAAQYVVKIEPHTNGPLFCELHFYQRAAKPDMIDDWCRSNRLKYIGIPKFIAMGSYTRGKENFRFMVMPRFGPDLQRVFEDSGKRLEKHTVFCLALRMIDALEYLHENQYVHADIKASNMLLGFNGGKVQPDQIYLVDFGLVHRYNPDNTHKPYKEDPRCCHDGTVEFTSIDAHKGVAPSRRGDMEILGYCLLQWLCSKLPWEDNLQNKDYVRDSKIKYTKDLNSLMKKCFPAGDPPAELSKYFTMVTKLGYEERPDYGKLRNLFKDGLKKLSWKDEWKLDLSISEAGAKKGVKRKTVEPDTPKNDESKVKRRTTKPSVVLSPAKVVSPEKTVSPSVPVRKRKASAKSKADILHSPPGRKSTATPKTLKQPLKSPRSETPRVKSIKQTPPSKTAQQPVSGPKIRKLLFFEDKTLVEAVSETPWGICVIL